MSSSKNKSTATSSSSILHIHSDISTSETSANATPTDDARSSRDSVQPVGLRDDSDACCALSLQAEVDREAFVNNIQQDTTTTNISGENVDKNQDGSEIKALDHIKDDQQGGSMLDDHDRALKLQTVFDGESSL